jgi:hypothetical protein
MLVLAAQGKIDYQTFLFANVGDDSEHPGTLRYLREIAMPYAAKHGITIHELHRTKRDGERDTIWSRMHDHTGSVAIPAFLGAAGPPSPRSCTADFKIRVVGKWLKAHGASPENLATVAVGISVDEIGRATSAHQEPYERLDYPLLDLRMRRDDCHQVIRRSGLPVPGKSACWFCPFQRPQHWREMARDDPARFEQACQLEDHLQGKYARGKRNPIPIYLSRLRVPLREAIKPAGDTLPGMDDDLHCDNGWCMT